jgi:phosphate transport system protein
MAASVRVVLDQELKTLQEGILHMGAMVNKAIDSSILALASKDTTLARHVINEDAKINDKRFSIEEAGLRIIATQQPVTVDLRRLMADIIIANELERMGDHAEGIARIVIRMGDEPLLKPLIDLPRMADACREMLSTVLEAYVDGNVGLARNVASRDVFLDDLYTQIFRELLTFMIEDQRTVTRGLYLLFAAHNLERIGDRITNIAERAIFIQSGEVRELNPEPDEAKIQ